MLPHLIFPNDATDAVSTVSILRRVRTAETRVTANDAVVTRLDPDDLSRGLLRNGNFPEHSLAWRKRTAEAVLRVLSKKIVIYSETVTHVAGRDFRHRTAFSTRKPDRRHRRFTGGGIDGFIFPGPSISPLFIYFDHTTPTGPFFSTVPTPSRRIESVCLPTNQRRIFKVLPRKNFTVVNSKKAALSVGWATRVLLFEM